MRSDEEQYMIEAAARLYCRPEVSYSTQTYQVEGRSVLLVQIDESDRKPVYAKDEAGKYLAICASRTRTYLPPRYICVSGNKAKVRKEN